MMLGKLNCGVSPTSQQTVGGKKIVTQIFIRLGPNVIADRVIPGYWNAEQGLKEFRRFPDRFTPRDPYTKETLKGVAV